MSERRASVDIGSNTALLLIADITKNQEKVTVKSVHEAQCVPRLGKNVDSRRVLSDESMHKAIDALTEYKSIIERHNVPSSPTVTATSAVRDASNKEEFLQRVKESTGWEIRLLSGDEEAQWSFYGALLALNSAEENPVAVLLDIGGGSTEVAAGIKNADVYELKYSRSANVGCVRHTERFLQNSPPGKDDVERCRQDIMAQFEIIKKDLTSSLPDFRSSEVLFTGVAGTVTSLAFLELGLTEYESEKISGHLISQKNVTDWLQKLSGMSVAEMEEKWPVVMEGRADIFIAGLIILESFMRVFEATEMIVSSGGIRYYSVLQQ